MRSNLKKMMDYCTFCPKMCTFSCPASEATRSTTYTPWGKMEIARWLVDKSVPLTQDLALAGYQCLNCLHCQQYCEHHNDVPSALLTVRQMAVENYVAPAEVYELERQFAEFNNPYGRDLLSPLRGEIPPGFLDKLSPVVFFPSCHTLHFFPERLNVYLELLQRLQIEGVVLFDEEVQCCGEPLRALGFAHEFEEIAEIQYYSLRNHKVVVTDGAECSVNFKKSYPTLRLPLKNHSVHLLEFLAPALLPKLKPSGKKIPRYAYHDPPYLSRYQDIVDLPRKILFRLTGTPPTFLPQWGKDTLASGTEGSYDAVFPEMAERIARRTVEEVRRLQVELLITADAKSEAMFRRLAVGFKVQDLYEFIREHLP